MARSAALILTPRFPWPLDDGGRIALWQSVVATARAHEVTLVSFVPPGQETEPIPEAVAMACADVVRIPHHPPRTPVAVWRGIAGRWPHTLARYTDQHFTRALRDAAERTSPRFVLVNNLHMAPYHADLGGVPWVLREQNAEHRWMQRYADSLGATPAGLYARLQARRLRAAERELCEKAALVLAIQEVEAEALRTLAPRARVRTLPVGVDLARFLEPTPVEPPVVLLPGSFAWKPNVDGALRFLVEGWPRVRDAVPQARLRIAGKAPPPLLCEVASRAGAEVAADVPSMPEEMSRASVIVVPLWVGAGARVKIVEAMAAQIPVVATWLAAEGLELEAGLHYLGGETAAELGKLAASLLRNPKERVRLAAQGRALAESRWSLECVARRQEALIQEALA